MILATYNNGNVDLPIIDTDSAIGGFTWRYLMDVYIANNGHYVTKKRLKEQLDFLMNGIKTDVYETFGLVADKMIEQIEKEYEDG